MSECPCSDIDEMDINLIIEALEHNHILYKSNQLNKFKESYFPHLIDKLRKWKEARENQVLEGLESGN